jgi:hypothetical protein
LEKAEATSPEQGGLLLSAYSICYIQKMCLPIDFICGRDQIHADVAVAGLK